MIGYNNQLKQATTNMKLGVNNNVNTETQKVGLRLMDGGPSKVNVPNSHPSNPIHKEAMKPQGIGGQKKRHPTNKPILRLAKRLHLCLTRKLPPSTIKIK